MNTQITLTRKVGYVKLRISGLKGLIAFADSKSGRCAASKDHREFFLLNVIVTDVSNGYLTTMDRDKILEKVSKHTGIPVWQICEMIAECRNTQPA